MRRLILLVVCGFGTIGYTQGSGDTAMVRNLLIDQLDYSYRTQNWFVPTKLAIDGLTAEQAMWKDSSENHSIIELVSHTCYWNEVYLRVLAGEDFSDLDIDNNKTFEVFTEKEWDDVKVKLDSIQIELERMVEKASKSQLSERASDLLDLTAHNAYHSGQIIYIRKQNGWWPSSKK
ncbi:MAG: DinB family protein [Bacteroidota bacterium]